MTDGAVRPRRDWYHPSRDADGQLFQEFQAKWRRGNAAAKAAAEAALARQPLQPPQPPAGPPAPDADWPPGYDTVLLSYIREHLPELGEEEAGALVEAARRGLLPANKAVIRTRYLHLKDLEPRFPGFSARDAVLGQPRLLRHSAAKLLKAMALFQDCWPSDPVGLLMPGMGEALLRDPVGVAHRLQALSRALRSELGVALRPREAFTPDRAEASAAFLAAAPYELEARVAALVTLFGRGDAAALVERELGVLALPSQVVDGAVGALREVFAARGHRVPVPADRHVGTPEGAAEAARDRAYVTALVVAWPGVLEAAAVLGEEGMARALALVRRAGMRSRREDLDLRYDGSGSRSRLLADVAARPELLEAAVLGVMGAGGGDEGVAGARVQGEVAERLGQMVSELGGSGGRGEGEGAKAVEGRS
ncbi:hypothetical protein HYH03_004990 [Edaphochlamys debaryana]|uniref:Uncharacterized protein n=1 Tax=Edaphochlamys debaryana TaxID=47281 RepID=A0A835YG50_9CHLO|nr:hypothetical protein HYH03_004990 [Edaphochlamys debaryana]|eukprot:KAG2496984.1 hypothetical protein HYH03_004990 [Edaphochlamys debaryana]